MSERRGYRVEDRRRVIPLEHRVNRHTSINPNTWRHRRENIPSMINERPETKAWNFVKNILPTGGNVGRHVGNYLSDREPKYFPWNVKANQPDQSGIMLALADNPAVNRIQSIYNQVDPFLPEVNWNDQRLGYEYNRDLWGGNLNIGGLYDVDDESYNLGINWGTNW